METIKVSVILPVHNAGEKLARCLDTLINQTLHEIEIICVLDCPTDGSDLVVKEYAAKDNRIIVLENKSNLHIGYSRNEGLKIARGEYVGFSDHDDYRDMDMYRQLYLRASADNADICMSNQCSITDGVKQVFSFPVPEIYSAQKVFKALLCVKPMSAKKPTLGNVRSVWNHIFKRSFIEQHEVTFPNTKIICHEDTLFCTRFFSHNPKISYVPKNFYYWLISSSSTLSNISYGNIYNNVRYVEAVCQLLKNQNEYNKYLPNLAEGMIRKLYSAVGYQRASVSGNVMDALKLKMSEFPTFKSLLDDIDKNKLRCLWPVPLTKSLFYLWFLSKLR